MIPKFKRIDAGHEKTVVCECGKIVILKLVGGQYQNSYINSCSCGRKWVLDDLSENLESD